MDGFTKMITFLHHLLLFKIGNINIMDKFSEVGRDSEVQGMSLL